MTNKQKLLLAIPVLLLAAWVAWLFSDTYQLREIRRQGHLLAVELYGKAPVESKAWFRAAALSNTDETVDAANRIPNPQARAEVLSAMAESLAQAGQTRRALWVTAEIRDTGELAVALRSLAGALLPGPAPDTDRDLANEALAKAPSDSSLRTTVLSAVSRALAWAGWSQAAESTARQVEDPAARAIAAAELALGAARQNDLVRAKLSAQQAQAAAGEILNPIQRATIYTALARAWANSPLWEAARHAAEKSAATAESITDLPARVASQSAAARALLSAGAKPEALALATKALAAARSASLPAEAQTAPIEAGCAAMAASGQLRKARKLAESAPLPLSKLTAFTVTLTHLPPA